MNERAKARTRTQSVPKGLASWRLQTSWNLRYIVASNAVRALPLANPKLRALAEACLADPKESCRSCPRVYGALNWEILGFFRCCQGHVLDGKRIDVKRYGSTESGAGSPRARLPVHISRKPASLWSLREFLVLQGDFRGPQLLTRQRSKRQQGAVSCPPPHCSSRLSSF